MKQNRNPRLRARCGECDADLDPEVASCTSCGAARPAKGWDVVAELRVYDRSDENPAPPSPSPPPARPASRSSSGKRKEKRYVPPSTPAWAQGSVYARLVAVYGGSFAGTTFAVLGLWFLGAAARPPAAPAAVAPVVAPAPVPPAAAPAPEPAPVETEDVLAPEEVDGDDGLVEADVAADPTQEPAVVPPVATAPELAPPARAPTPEPPSRAAPPEPASAARTAAPEPASPEPEPAPEPPVTAAVAAPPPVVAPPPEPAKPPAAAARLNGTYVGKAAGRPVSIDLEFLANGDLHATVRINDGTTTATIDASGQYTLSSDGVATITFVERDVAEPSVYAGTADGSMVDGRVTTGGKNKGRLLVAR